YGFGEAVGKAHGADGEASKRLRKESFRPAIERLRVQNDVARAGESEDRGGNRRHAGREQRAILGALVDREPVLDDLAIGVIEPRINQARAHPTDPVNVARISVATSGTNFTASEADFAALIRAAGFCLGDYFCHVGAAGVGVAPGPLLADTVAKVFLVWRTKNLRAADAFYAR